MSRPNANNKRNQLITALANIQNYSVIDEGLVNSDGVPYVTVFVKYTGDVDTVLDFMANEDFESYIPLANLTRKVHIVVSYLGFNEIVVNEGYPYELNKFTNGGFSFNMYIGQCDTESEEE